VCAALAALPLLAACELNLPGYDGGSEGGTDATTDSGAQTVGDQCATIVTEFCRQVGMCNGAALADCLANDMPMCCVGAACDAGSASSSAAVSACTEAIDVEDCNSVQAGLPAACQGVPTPE
jgi:hypothetical protein